MGPFQTTNCPVLVGHRGAPRSAQENTVASFLAAAAAGAEWVELDARLCGDGTVVVHHDARMPDGVALLERDAAQLAGLGIESLADVLAALPAGLGVDVECKNLPGQPDFFEDLRLAEAVGLLLEREVGQRPLLASSFDPLTVEALARALPDLPTGLLHGDTLALEAAGEIAADVGAEVLCPHVDATIGPAEVAAAHAAGFAVLVWTVDVPARAVQLAAAGVDALCTNDPAAIAAALRRAA